MQTINFIIVYELKKNFFYKSSMPSQWLLLSPPSGSDLYSSKHLPAVVISWYFSYHAVPVITLNSDFLFPLQMTQCYEWYQCKSKTPRLYYYKSMFHANFTKGGVVRAPDSWLKGRGFESRGRIFFSNPRVDFPCWLLFRYPFHPRVTTVARKKSRSFCQKCRCQVTAKHAYTLRMWILLNRASALVTTCP